MPYGSLCCRRVGRGRRDWPEGSVSGGGLPRTAGIRSAAQGGPFSAGFASLPSPHSIPMARLEKSERIKTVNGCFSVEAAQVVKERAVARCVFS